MLSSSGGGLQVPKPQFLSLNSPQRAASASSSNGANQSKKVALAPGHSLMDWIRLGQKEGRKLNGVGGQIRNVSVEELASHNKVDDAWMSVRGKVYNVTPYMSFHPGGENEMMRGAGGDGTRLFDDVHQWVNLESMLEKCYIGQLRKTIAFNKSSAKGVTSLSEPSVTESEPADRQKPKARYDWYQNAGKITITIYAKCNSVKSEHLVIDRKQHDFRATLILDDHVYTVHIVEITFTSVLTKNTEYNGALLQFTQLIQDTSLFEDITNTYEGIKVIAGPIHRVVFVLNKKDPDKKWVTLGAPLEGSSTMIPRRDKEPLFRQCKVITCRSLTHDIKLFGLELPQGCHMSLPMGYHVYLRVCVNGDEISRPYTAVSPSLLPQDYTARETNGRVIYLMIKMYPDGQLTQQLAQLVQGDTIEVSDYEGNFVESRLHQASHLTLVAAGTGFTPMVKLLHWSLVQQKRTPKQIKLIFFNKTEGDIPWRDDLMKLADTRRQSFEVVNILSEPDQRWTGPKGRIRQEIVEEHVTHPSQHPNERHLMCICGPTPFSQLAFKLSQAYGYTGEMINVFAA